MIKKATLKVTIKGGPMTGKSTVAQIVATALQSYGFDISISDDTPFSAFSIIQRAEALSSKTEIEINTEQPRPEPEIKQEEAATCREPDLSDTMKVVRLHIGSWFDVEDDKSIEESLNWQYCNESASFKHTTDCCDFLLFIPSDEDAMRATVREMLDSGCSIGFVEAFEAACRIGLGQGACFIYLWN